MEGRRDCRKLNELSVGNLIAHTALQHSYCNSQSVRITTIFIKWDFFRFSPFRSFSGCFISTGRCLHNSLKQWWAFNDIQPWMASLHIEFKFRNLSDQVSFLIIIHRHQTISTYSSTTIIIITTKILNTLTSLAFFYLCCAFEAPRMRGRRFAYKVVNMFRVKHYMLL